MEDKLKEFRDLIIGKKPKKRKKPKKDKIYFDFKDKRWYYNIENDIISPSF